MNVFIHIQLIQHFRFSLPQNFHSYATKQDAPVEKVRWSFIRKRERDIHYHLSSSHCCGQEFCSISLPLFLSPSFYIISPSLLYSLSCSLLEVQRKVSTRNLYLTKMEEKNNLETSQLWNVLIGKQMEFAGNYAGCHSQKWLKWL